MGLSMGWWRWQGIPLTEKLISTEEEQNSIEKYYWLTIAGIRSKKVKGDKSEQNIDMLL